MTEISITLPPEGLIIRDFILTAFAYICRKISAEMETLPTKIIIYSNFSSIAGALTKILDELEGNLPPPGLYSRGRTKQFLTAEMFAYYKGLISQKENQIKDVLNSLSMMDWRVSSKDEVILIGKNPNLPAPLLFKINYYAGKRIFLPCRYRDAKIKMDKNALFFTSVGAALARSAVLRINDKRVSTYISVLNPGAIGLHSLLHGLLREIRGRFAPDVIFKVLVSFKLRTRGVLPMRIMAINEGRQRPALLSCQDISIDEGTIRFVEELDDYSSDMLSKLLIFSLRNWETVDRNRRAIIRVGFDLAQAIYLASTGAMRPSDVIYYIARSTYATTSDEFNKALKEVRDSPIQNIEAFKTMILKIEASLEQCQTL